MKPTEATNLVDVHIGARIRVRREGLGLTQESVARDLDLTTAEVAAFESGRSRVSAVCLYDIARLLDVKVAYFFESVVSGASRNLTDEDSLHEAAVRFGYTADDMVGALPQ